VRRSIVSLVEEATWKIRVSSPIRSRNPKQPPTGWEAGEPQCRLLALNVRSAVSFSRLLLEQELTWVQIAKTAKLTDSVEKVRVSTRPNFSAPSARFSDADAGGVIIHLRRNGASSKSICGGN
jgi:hypothetical protein